MVRSRTKTLVLFGRCLLKAQYSAPITRRQLPPPQPDRGRRVRVRAQTANGGGSAKALDYTLKRWASLIRYAQTGHLPIDNNQVENVIRPIAIGKKNWLFTGSERAGQRAAAIQTLLGTALLNALNPSDWLKDTLITLPTWPTAGLTNYYR